MATEQPIIICTRGSALALAQSNMIAAQCRAAFPRLTFELKIIKTTGDKLQKASMAKTKAESLPKGLFTKELEVALLKGQADLAVHSLKDLPVDLPAGLVLAATPRREDVRDVLLYRAAKGRFGPAGAGSSRTSNSRICPRAPRLPPAAPGAKCRSWRCGRI